MRKEVTLDYLSRVRIPAQFMKQLGWDLPDRDKKLTQTLILEVKDDTIVISRKPLLARCIDCDKMFSTEYSFCPHCGKPLE